MSDYLPMSPLVTRTMKSRSHYAMRTFRPILERRGLLPRCA
ncbi:hypothetical protein J2Z21_000764 [Streptomyces griseochromogenes]|uniref:Integrase n=1 Tax=Streptomyces griseochromogenes TaxID=68214 RepID=A0ABS4LKC0_9ACTN|nr:hypothetical protein [Streptomyces griseochromogenes]